LHAGYRGEAVKRALLLMILAAGCTRGAPSLPVDPGPGAPSDLAASLGARVHGDTVAFTLHITNPANGPVRIEFPTTQRYDFEVLTPSGSAVWQWSATRAFGQVLGAVDLRAGQSLDYTEEWPASRAGDYIARSRLVSTNKPVDLRTPFTVPSH
jgi:hypothetical protein